MNYKKGFTRTPILVSQLVKKVLFFAKCKINIMYNNFFVKKSRKTKPNLAFGFTLIELLVVIAIIGLLSSVVLASLRSASNKGGNAAVKANLSNMRAQAALFYDANNGSYNFFCSSGSYGNPPVSSGLVMYNAALAAGLSAGSTCTASGGSWSAVVQLKTPEPGGSFWCVDSTGGSKATSGNCP